MFFKKHIDTKPNMIGNLIFIPSYSTCPFSGDSLKIGETMVPTNDKDWTAVFIPLEETHSVSKITKGIRVVFKYVVSSTRMQKKICRGRKR